MQKMSKFVIGLSVLASIFALGYVLIVNMRSEVSLGDKREAQRSVAQQYKASEKTVMAEKRPKVTKSTDVLNGFFGAMLDYQNQSTFDERAKAAQKFATPEAIENSHMFEPDKAKLVTQLNQKSHLDQVQFFPNNSNHDEITGSVLVTNTAIEGKDEDKQGQVLKGYQVVVDTKQDKVVKIIALGRFNAQTDSKALAED